MFNAYERVIAVSIGGPKGAHPASAPKGPKSCFDIILFQNVAMLAVFTPFTRLVHSLLW